MTRPFFGKNRISDFDNFEKHTSTTIALMKERLREGHPVEFQVITISYLRLSHSTFFSGRRITIHLGFSY